MSAIAMVGSVTLLLSERALRAHFPRRGTRRLRGLLPARLAFLVPFAAGNFIYIGAADLIPEVKAHAELRANIVHFTALGFGIVLMLALKIALEA